MEVVICRINTLYQFSLDLVDDGVEYMYFLYSIKTYYTFCVQLLFMVLVVVESYFDIKDPSLIFQGELLK